MGILPAAPGAGPKTDQEIEAWLPALLEPGKRWANIEPAEGAWLRDVVKKVQGKRALEIGTSTGYSGIWILMGLRQTGGKLITIEIDPGRHKTANANFKAAGLDGMVDSRLGDALKVVPQVDGPLDLVFIDALKSDYLKYYELVLPKMRHGGVIVAHNTASHANEMRDFLDRIRSDPKVTTELITPGYQGFSVTYVK
ncbi:MAG TPA: O-methyltransferase [Bryobacteraceae bacterium]|nr:O-methyltransferase [Bryobacteraceae bacterium]